MLMSRFVFKLWCLFYIYVTRFFFFLHFTVVLYCIFHFVKQFVNLSRIYLKMQ